ncbi:hypothetical protein TRVA0_029S00232 [Trichomonascus vanleenenianus]|uniref:uncharacterized protein n=1 Tax=Trichomonascus vanleenenianus TaxID=2268995 RepID=UPI003ECAC0D3
MDTSDWEPSWAAVWAIAVVIAGFIGLLVVVAVHTWSLRKLSKQNDGPLDYEYNMEKQDGNEQLRLTSLATQLHAEYQYHCQRLFLIVPWSLAMGLTALVIFVGVNTPPSFTPSKFIVAYWVGMCIAPSAFFLYILKQYLTGRFQNDILLGEPAV